jgi:uncharacterized protein YjiS (DUF1127 family)
MKTDYITRFEALSSESTAVNLDPQHVRKLITQARLERSAAIGAAIGTAVASGVFLVKRAGSAIKARWQQNRNIAALAAMDDRMLKDLGIDRYQIPQLVRGGVTGLQPEVSLFELGQAANVPSARHAA